MESQQIATCLLVQSDWNGQIVIENIKKNLMGKAELQSDAFELCFGHRWFITTRQNDFPMDFNGEKDSFDIKILASSFRLRFCSCLPRLGSGLNEAGSDYG